MTRTKYFFKWLFCRRFHITVEDESMKVVFKMYMIEHKGCYYVSPNRWGKSPVYHYMQYCWDITDAILDAQISELKRGARRNRVCVNRLTERLNHRMN